jgi:hypothetical protein
MATAIGSGVLYEASTTGSGTGNYDSFLRIAHNGDETGFNTDVPHLDDNKDGIWTHSLQVGTLDTVNISGVDYFVIRLDLNEIQSGDSPNITLEDLELFRSAAPAVDDSFAGMTKVFDLGAALNLVDTNHGSGTDDYVFYIPVSLFPDPNQYFTLYAELSGADDGFEEFRALSTSFTPTPDIGVTKETNGTDDQCGNILVGENVTWTYTVENNGNVALSNIVVMDDNGTPGDTTDDFAATYVSGDTNTNGILDTTETWIFTASGTAVAGEYANIATVSGDYVSGLVTTTVTGSEDDCYFGATPSVGIVKMTNGTDNTCPTILAGEAVTWTYNVTNTGDLPLSNVVVSDDNGTPLNLGDDFHPTAVLGVDAVHNIGDVNNDNILDLTETWQYTASGTAGAGEYLNVATVSGDATDDSQNSTTVNGNESDCYYGATPAIDIVKMTNGTDDQCPIVPVGSTVTWTYNVTNAGDIGLTNVVVTDDNGTPGNTGDDFHPAAVLAGGFNVGDTNQDNVLDLNETWQYSATGTAVLGHYFNIATVTGDATDDFQNTTTVNANEDDCYVAVEGPGVRTPGFWANPKNGGQFWDGIAGNEKHAGGDCFPTGELLYAVDSNHNGSIGAGDVAGLLIGDYNKNGIQDAGEDVFFIGLNDARNLLTSNTKQMSDGVVKIGRDVVATWLNYLAGNPIGNESDTGSPHHFIDDAVDYLQIFGDSSSSNTNNASEVFDKYSTSHTAVKTSSAFWNSNFPGGDHSGSQIHSSLDEYNNFGTVGGIAYAHSCDNEQFLFALKGYALDGALFAA